MRTGRRDLPASDPAAAFRAVPDFRYTRPNDGLGLTHQCASAVAWRRIGCGGFW